MLSWTLINNRRLLYIFSMYRSVMMLMCGVVTPFWNSLVYYAFNTCLAIVICCLLHIYIQMIILCHLIQVLNILLIGNALWHFIAERQNRLRLACGFYYRISFEIVMSRFEFQPQSFKWDFRLSFLSFVDYCMKTESQ